MSTFGRTCEHCELGELGFKVLDAGGYIPLRHVTHVTLSVTHDALSFEGIMRVLSVLSVLSVLFLLTSLMIVSA